MTANMGTALFAASSPKLSFRHARAIMDRVYTLVRTEEREEQILTFKQAAHFVRKNPHQLLEEVVGTTKNKIKALREFDRILVQGLEEIKSTNEMLAAANTALQKVGNNDEETIEKAIDAAIDRYFKTLAKVMIRSRDPRFKYALREAGDTMANVVSVSLGIITYPFERAYYDDVRIVLLFPLMIPIHLSLGIVGIVASPFAGAYTFIKEF